MTHMTVNVTRSSVISPVLQAEHSFWSIIYGTFLKCVFLKIDCQYDKADYVERKIIAERT